MQGGYSLVGSSGTLKRDVQEVLGSGQFSVTPEIGRELQHLNRGSDHIRLDSELLGSSREWGQKFDPQTIRAEQQGASQAIDAANASLFDMKNTLASRRVQELPDNQARETHYLAKQKLSRAEQAIGPYAHASADRIKQFCDHIGVTDRYTGYRHNLNRGTRDPVRLGYSWLDKQDKNAYNNTLNVGWKPQTSTQNRLPPTHFLPRNISAPVGDVAKTHNSGFVKRSPPLSHQRCIQEQCGISMRFPGPTECKDRFDRPKPLVEVTPDYRVNPAPDFTIFGRPNARAEVLRNTTECQSRYEWPDSDKIDKRPWIRI